MHVFVCRRQDVRLKVVILELLAVCVETQPGLTEMYLNVQLAPLTSATAQHSAGDTTPAPTGDAKPVKDRQGQPAGPKEKKDLCVGRSSCLLTLLDLIEEKMQVTVKLHHLEYCLFVCLEFCFLAAS